MKPVLSIVVVTCCLAPAVARAQQAPPDPIATHTISLGEALKGLKGSGAFSATIDIEQSGKPMGTLTCTLFDTLAPKTVANFVGLARGTRPFLDEKANAWVKRPFYDGLLFHRVIPDLLIQGGDPRGTGSGNAGYVFEDEFVDTLKIDKPGVLAMGNVGPDTNGSQFFITEKAAAWLTKRHTVFGQCDPSDLVGKLARIPSNPTNNRPLDGLVIKKVTISRAAKKKH